MEVMQLGFGRRTGAGRSKMLAAVLGVSLFLTLSVYSQNLVQNGNFDANGGSFEDWQISHTGPGPNYSGPNIAHPGYVSNPNYARFLFELNGGEDVLSQNIATTVGAVYDISFMAEDGAGHDFAAELNFGNFSVNLLNSFSIGSGEWYNGWTNFSFDVTASELNSELSFAIAADSGSEFGLDDISIVQLPVLQGVVVGKTFQVTVSSPASPTIVQACTDQCHWVNVVTNTPPFTYTDSISQYPRRYYRAAVIVKSQ